MHHLATVREHGQPTTSQYVIAICTSL